MPEADFGHTHRPAQQGIPAGEGRLTRSGFAFLVAATAASRLPFLWNGYGSDADAWRVAASAHALAETGIYAVSRFPGYPLHELIAAPLVLLGGAPLSNALSLLAMLLLLVAARPVAEKTAHHPALLLAAFAFTPLLWKNSTTTMDYLPSLLFLFLAAERLIAGRPLIAGLCTGLAAGCRPTSFAAVVPFTLLLLINRSSPRRLLTFLLAAAGTALLSLLPPILTYGLRGWFGYTTAATAEFRFSPAERLLLFGYRTVYSIGPLAWIAAGIAAWRGRRLVALAWRNRDAWPTLSLFFIPAFLLLYLWFPLEREYLIPLLPFLFLLVDRVATRPQMIAFVLCLVSFGAVNPDVIRHHGTRGSPGFNIHSGLMMDYVEKQNLIHRKRAELGGLEVPGPALVMTGAGPDTWIENPALERDPDPFWRFLPEAVVHRRGNHDVHFIDGLTRGQLDTVRAAGYTVFCYRPAVEYLEKIVGYRMNEEKVMLVPSP